MGPTRAERRREKWILWHVLIISCLLVAGLWGFFGVLPSPGEMVAAYWYRMYWDSTDEGRKLQALEHLFHEKTLKADRTFSNAYGQKSAPLRSIARRWFTEHGVDPDPEISY